MINSLYTTVSGLRTAQTQIEVSMNNISNQESIGYKKRDVDSSEVNSNNNLVGFGSKVDGVNRAINKALENKLQVSIGRNEYYTTQEKLIGTIDESSINGLDSDSIKGITDAFETLKSNPNDNESKRELIAKIDLFAYNTNSFLENIDRANNDAVDGAIESVSKINEITEKISEVNKTISLEKHPPLDMLDKRESLEKELSEYIKFDASLVNGIYKLSIDGMDLPLVSGSDSNKLYLKETTVEKEYANPKYSQYIDSNGAYTNDNTDTSKTYTNNPDFKADYKPYKYNIQKAELFILDPNEASDKSNVVNLDQFTKSSQGALAAQLNYASDDMMKNDLLQGKHMMISFSSNFKEEISNIKNDNGESLNIYNIDFQDSQSNAITTSSINEYNKIDIKLVEDAIDIFKDTPNLIDGMSANMDIHEQENYMRASLHSIHDSKVQMVSMEESAVAMYQKESDRISKVDPTEELIEVMQYQAAYQANAKMVQVVDEMIQTLLGMKR